MTFSRFMKRTFKLIDQKSQEFIQLVKRTMPSNLRLSMDGLILSKEDIIKHLEKKDKIGKQLVQIHNNFTEAVKSGELARKIKLSDCNIFKTHICYWP